MRVAFLRVAGLLVLLAATAASADGAPAKSADGAAAKSAPQLALSPASTPPDYKQWGGVWGSYNNRWTSTNGFGPWGGYTSGENPLTSPDFYDNYYGPRGGGFYPYYGTYATGSPFFRGGGWAGWGNGYGMNGGPVSILTQTPGGVGVGVGLGGITIGKHRKLLAIDSAAAAKAATTATAAKTTTAAKATEAMTSEKASEQLIIPPPIFGAPGPIAWGTAGPVSWGVGPAVPAPAPYPWGAPAPVAPWAPAPAPYWGVPAAAWRPAPVLGGLGGPLRRWRK